MLLPSALTCEASQTSPLPRVRTGLFVSPPASPPSLSSQYSIDNIMDTCRSLQSLISMTANNSEPPALAPAPSLTQLPTPPMAHAPTPIKLRLRSRACRTDHKGEERSAPRRKIAKRAPPRGANKRRRCDDDDMDRNDESELEYTESESESESHTNEEPAAPSTPKRARIAPEQLPLGLERSDYHRVHLLNGGRDGLEHPEIGTDVDVGPDGIEWSAEDDRILVELVLEKLKLSKTEWQDCARSLGKDRHSVNRRWKSLMVNGEVGIKTRSRRAKLHGTWR